ncbi:MAG: HNH endonuclease [Acidobacteria bacterium]|nr:HNH endonuclease [Acidobacteriota bacterium]
MYERTSGKCHLCHRKLAYVNYGVNGKRGAWHVDHSRALANGGTHRKNNLYPACISCNLEKGTFTTRTARRWAGKSKAPLSRKSRAAAKVNNALESGIAGAGIGAAIGGPPGAIVGAIIGAVVGHSRNPDR